MGAIRLFTVVVASLASTFVFAADPDGRRFRR